MSYTEAIQNIQTAQTTFFILIWQHCDDWAWFGRLSQMLQFFIQA